MKDLDGKEVILPTSDEAATYRTDIAGWVSRGGRFYGDGPNAEYSARWAGATHILCKRCGTYLKSGGLTLCPNCRSKKEVAKHEARETAKWDGAGMVYSELLGEYYDQEALCDCMADDYHNSASELQLVICRPVHLREVDYDHWFDELSTDDGGVDLPLDVEDAIYVLNAVIRAQGAVSYEAGEIAVQLDKFGQVDYGEAAHV